MRRRTPSGWIFRRRSESMSSAVPLKCFSVVIPARDEEESLPSTVGNIFEIFRAAGIPHEIVVVDDGSIDGTGSLLQRLARAHSQLRVFHTRGVGVVGALAVGLAQCRNPWIARMDADDDALPRRLGVGRGALEAAPERAPWGGARCRGRAAPGGMTFARGGASAPGTW